MSSNDLHFNLSKRKENKSGDITVVNQDEVSKRKGEERERY